MLGRGHAHVKDQRTGKSGQRLVVELWALLVVAFLAGHQGDGRGVAPVRDGDARVSRCCQGGRYPWHGFVRNTGTTKGFGFLGTATEDVGVSPFSRATTRPDRAASTIQSLIWVWGTDR